MRGYRENQFVRDSGAAATLELMLKPFAAALYVVPFVDAGLARNHATSNVPVQTDALASAGVGLMWKPRADLGAELFVAQALKPVEMDGKALQDQGIHFAIQYRK